MARTTSLVIVESPAKARTIAGFLGDGFVVESSIGHIRDLPRNAAEVPAAYKKHQWAKKLGVDVENGFRPLYVVDKDKKSHIAKLKELLKQAHELYLATDEDREGESIAWHLTEVLKPQVDVKRMVFHEITPKAIEHALKHPREVDRRLVEAQETRRILDRLYGFEVSRVLWKKVMPKLSAGRVQSVATRIIVERERERKAFVPACYWDVEGTFAALGKTPPRFSAGLISVDGQRIATGKDFASTGQLSKSDAVVLDSAAAEGLATALQGRPFEVRNVERKPSRRSPYPPFMTSTLQQEASRKLRFSASRTMRAAQRLYESGYITYMRTDSTTLSAAAVASARAQIERLYGPDYLPSKPRVYRNKVKNAQEAHEAIRPAGDVFRRPEVVLAEVGGDEGRLYELIWMRTIASQMRDSEGESVTLRLGTRLDDGRDVEFSVSGHTITFPGFLRAYVEGSDDPTAELENRERPLPRVAEGDTLEGEKFDPKGHETQPPGRFTEASLVRKLEELGVGRPSTYASIITTILDRRYVWKKGSALVPSFTAFAVVALLEGHFGELVDYAFTARMEDDLDEIANGRQEMVPWLKAFFFGKSNGDPAAAKGLDRGLAALVEAQLSEIDARAINSILVGEDDGQPVVLRVGRYGAYLQRGEETASVPDDLPPDELTLERALEILRTPSSDRKLGEDPETGLPVLIRNGRFGAYVQLGEAGAGKEKPRTSSLLRSMSPETVALEDALQLLTLPRRVGVDPSDGQEITAQLGRYGPYVVKGSESRSLEHENQVFDVTLDQALALFAQPKTRARRAAAAEPLRELGQDPVSGKTIVLREGRFGPYVTDGDGVNASLRRDDDPSKLTHERAAELLQERRDRGPVRAKGRKKPAAGAQDTTDKKARGGARGAKPAPKAAKKAAGQKPATSKKPTGRSVTKKVPAKRQGARSGSEEPSPTDAPF